MPNTVSIEHLPSLSEDELSIDPSQQHHKLTIPTATTIKKKKGGCTCKKTKCLKMYCECFREGKVCGEDCSCEGCINDEDHKECREKIQESLLSKSASRQQGKGCNCRKSQCQKKYC